MPENKIVVENMVKLGFNELLGPNLVITTGICNIQESNSLKQI
jgi:hypothetical protein